jgi:rubrerythrin
MTPVEALEVALKKEETSIALYQDLIAKHSEIKDLLFRLLNEEEKHKKMIEEKIVELTR